MLDPAISATPASQAAARVMFVDDEANILSALRRMFRTEGYTIVTAESGAAALEMLGSEPVDLVISDMRMPEMDGAQFLEQVRGRWPDTIRLLLTGYSDVELIKNAINQGEIYRYVTKPWDDDDIKLIVRHGLERRFLQQEKLRLEALTRRQNEALKELNASLEAKVAERTRELQKAHDTVIAVNGKLKTNFLTSIKVFSNLIEMRGASPDGHSLKVADLARKIAVRMGLDATAVQDVFLAALLHKIGKIAFSDHLLGLPMNSMNGEELGQFRKHPARAEQLLMPLQDLANSAKILRSQMERFDGVGTPDGLTGANIPLGARILALCSDYFNLQNGMLLNRRLSADDARLSILKGRGRRYDPQVIEAFDFVVAPNPNAPPHEIEVSSNRLLPGMAISRDLLSRDGFLLLSADHVIDQRLIEKMLAFETTSGTRLSIWVRQERKS